MIINKISTGTNFGAKFSANAERLVKDAGLQGYITVPEFERAKNIISTPNDSISTMDFLLLKGGGEYIGYDYTACGYIRIDKGDGRSADNQNEMRRNLIFFCDKNVTEDDYKKNMPKILWSIASCIKDFIEDEGLWRNSIPFTEGEVMQKLDNLSAWDRYEIKQG